MRGAPRDRPLLLGHRGARACKSIPENTFPSFDQALADGCDGFEFDVRLTADGLAVVCHDAHSDGMEIALASGQRCPRLPRLEDVLARYGGRAFLDIELKVAGLERLTAEVLKAYPATRGIVVSSFLAEVLDVMHKEDSRIPLGLICETRAELERWTQLQIEYVIPHYKLVRARLIEEVKAAGKKMLVWTVNSRAQMERLREQGVDGIISDDTRLLAETLA